MTTIIIIEKSGTIKERTVKSLTEDSIYKAAGFKTATDFKCHTVWNVDIADVSYSIELYGKTTGRAGQENKYEFPPPVDNTLFFGGCVIINRCKTTREFLNLRESEWMVIYNHLYGGFEDIEMSDDDDDEDDEDEFDSEDELPKTKNGYAKDGFVVDDDADDDDDDDDADDDDDEDDEDEDDSDNNDDDFEDKCKPVAKKGGGGGRSRVAISKTKKSTAAVVPIEPIQTAESIYLDCTTELTEEEYDD
jgi:hypothetical protein